MKPTVLIPELIAPPGLELLERECNVIAPWKDGATDTESDSRALLPQADAVVVRLFRVDEADLARSEHLKIISKHGVGLDNIDLEAATRRKVAVATTLTANSNAVAEQTLALMFALARHTPAAFEAAKAGLFAERHRFVGQELQGRTLGIVGVGRIGSRVATKAALGLGMEVRAYDPPLDKSTYDGPAVFENSLATLLAKSDILTLHVPLTDETRYMINAETLALMQPGALLINTCRGGVVDGVALVAALDSGALRGAALDVFEEEPLPADHPFCRTPGLLITPHVSAATEESYQLMSVQAAEAVLDVLGGRVPEGIVDPAALE